MNTKHVLKKSLLLLAAPLAMLSVGAHAVTPASPNSVEVNFVAAVQGTTCSGVEVAGGNTVNFGTVAPTDFVGGDVGAVASTMPVNINLSGCTLTGLTSITPQLIATASHSDPDAIANGLTDIGAAVELYDTDSTTAIKPNTMGTPIAITDATATTMTIPLVAKLVQETATVPTPGNVQSNTIISLTYS